MRLLWIALIVCSLPIAAPANPRPEKNPFIAEAELAFGKPMAKWNRSERIAFIKEWERRRDTMEADARVREAVRANQPRYYRAVREDGGVVLVPVR